MKLWQKFCQRTKETSSFALIFGSGCILIIVSVIALQCGAIHLPFSAIIEMDDIIKYIRLPRILAAIFAGAGLSGAGVIIQTIFANPLAGPNIIGINSGAGFFTILCGILFPFMPALQPLFAFFGALTAVMLIYILSRKCSASKVTILLAGVVLNSIFNGATEVVYTFFPDTLTNITAFRTGGLAIVQTKTLYPAMLLILLFVLLVGRKLNTLKLLSLGDDIAHSLGVSVQSSRFFFLISASCLAGSAVSFAGLIGFLGLMVPHAVRQVSGYELDRLFPLSVLWGGIFMVICDTFARTAFAPFEISVGIILSILGAPLFIWMLLHRSWRNETC